MYNVLNNLFYGLRYLMQNAKIKELSNQTKKKLKLKIEQPNLNG